MLKTLRQAPFLRLLLFFATGVICYYSSRNTGLFSMPILCFGCVAILLCSYSFLRHHYSYRWLFGLVLFCITFTSGVLLTKNQLQCSNWNLSPGIHIYHLKLTDDPVQKPKTRMCKAEIINAENEIQREVIHKKIIVYLPLDSLSLSLLPGDCILAEIDLNPPKPATKQSSFDYAAYLFKQGFAATGFVRKGNWKKTSSAEQSFFNLKFQALKCRYQLLKFIHAIIPDERSAALASAMVFGFRNDMDKDLVESFSATGVSHILSVSGMHVGILYSLFLFLFSALGNGWKKRVIQQLIIITILWFFAFLTGLSPSVVRCVTMLTLTGMGIILSKGGFTLNTVAASAFFMLLYNPMYLYDVSFQLSYMAVVSIVVINPWLTQLYETKHIILKYIWELSCVSVSAQLGTLPLTLYYFHQFPTIFLLSNLFVIPLTGILMLLIPLSLLLFQCFPLLEFLLIPVNQFLSIYISGVEFLEKIPFGIIKGINLDLGGAFLILFTLISIGILFVKKRLSYLYLFILLVVFQVFYYL